MSEIKIMNIDFNREDIVFKKQIEDFIEQKLDKDLQNKIYNGEKPNKDEVIDWQIKLNEKGWLAPDWPLEYGGCDWTPTQKYIFEQEMANANTPQVVPFGVTMIGPVLIKHGTPEQKSYFLPKILNSDDIGFDLGCFEGRIRVWVPIGQKSDTLSGTNIPR